MMRLERQIGWYAVICTVIAPLWVITNHPMGAITWLLGNALGYGVAWYYIRQLERRYRKAMELAIAMLPESPDLAEFRSELLKGIKGGLPVLKMNRWLGYLQGQLVAKGLITAEKIAADTRPLFRPIDFGPRSFSAGA